MISIIIPTYNGCNTIITCLNSLVQQIHFHYEVIVIVDGSTDNTIKTLQNFFHENPVDYQLYIQDNSGVSRSRNQGIALSKYDYILFLDDDDVIVNIFYDTVLKIVTSKADLSFFEYQIDYGEKKIIRSFISYNNEYTKKIEILNDYFSFRKKRISFQVTSVIFRKEFLTENNIEFDINFSTGEDSAFILKTLLLSKNIHVWNEVLFEYKFRAYSVSNRYNIRLFDGYYSLRNLYLNITTKDNKFNNIYLQSINLRAMNSLVIAHLKNLNKVLARKSIHQLNEYYHSIHVQYPYLRKDYWESLKSVKFGIGNYKMKLIMIFHLVFIRVFYLSFIILLKKHGDN